MDDVLKPCLRPVYCTKRKVEQLMTTVMHFQFIQTHCAKFITLSLSAV